MSTLQSQKAVSRVLEHSVCTAVSVTDGNNPVATLGTRRVLKRYRNSTINICKSRLEVHLVNTSVVLVLFGYSKGARKVSGKCIKGTPAVLRGCLQVTRLLITARDYFSWITSRRQAQFLADLYLS